MIGSASAIDRFYHYLLTRQTGGVSPAGLWLSYLDWAVHLSLAPGTQAKLVSRAMSDAVAFQHYLASSSKTPTAKLIASTRPPATGGSRTPSGAAGPSTRSSKASSSAEAVVGRSDHEHQGRKRPPCRTRELRGASSRRHGFTVQLPGHEPGGAGEDRARRWRKPASWLLEFR